MLERKMYQEAQCMLLLLEDQYQVKYKSKVNSGCWNAELPSDKTRISLAVAANSYKEAANKNLNVDCKERNPSF